MDEMQTEQHLTPPEGGFEHLSPPSEDNVLVEPDNDTVLLSAEVNASNDEFDNRDGSFTRVEAFTQSRSRHESMDSVGNFSTNNNSVSGGPFPHTLTDTHTDGQSENHNQQLRAGWEKKMRKHIFILSSSGKPIFSMFGDEQEMVTTFGLLQAVVSIVQDSGDNIKCIRAGRRKIVYLIKGALYFVCVSSTSEPEAILSKQLEFLYDQILLVLSSKVLDILRENYSKDLRDLLGTDTTRLMHAACPVLGAGPGSSHGTPGLTHTAIAFECIQGLPMDKGLREDVQELLQSCVDRSGAVVGMLLCGDGLVAYALGAELPLVLAVSDVLLLTHFVANSTSLRHHEQNWVPVCLPAFNAKAFLQAYIGDLRLPSFASAQSQTHPTSPKGATTQATPQAAIHPLSLVLVCTSQEANTFKELHEGRLLLEQQMAQPDIHNRLSYSLRNWRPSVNKYLAPSMCLHFFFKFRPSAVDVNQAQNNGSKANTPLVPAQFVCTDLDFPVDNTDSFERIWVQYQRLALCLRRGASTPESTLLPLVDSTVTPLGMASSGGDPSNAVTFHTPSPNLTLAQGGTGGGGGGGVASPHNATGNSQQTQQPQDRSSRAKSIRNMLFAGKEDQQAAAAPANKAVPADDSNIMRGLPSSDHSLVYSMMSTGHVIVALATSESEFYGTFPGPLSALDACGMANMLSRSLRAEAGTLFQANINAISK